MTVPTDFVTTHQCLKDLSEKHSIGPILANSLAKEDMPFEKRTCKEITSLLRRNTQNLSELILFFDGLYKCASELSADNPSVEASALFNFLLQQFTKSDFLSVGPLKVHNGNISKYPAKKETEVHELMVELMRIKTELKMLMDGTLPQACVTKFNSLLYSSNDLKHDNDEEANVTLKDLAREKYMALSSQREERRKLKKPKACSDCPENPTLYCGDCQLYRCQFCSQKVHRNQKGHKEMSISAVKQNMAGKMNLEFQSAISAEQDLAFLINRDNPWDERTLQQQQKLTSSSEQIRLLRDSIAKDRNLSKGIHESEVSRAFHLAKGDAEKALQILKKWRQTSLDILKHANIVNNPNEQLNTAQGDVAKILSESSYKELKSDAFKIGPTDVHLEQLLNDKSRDRQLRQRMAFTELFSCSPQGWERSHFLIKILEYGSNADLRANDDNDRWWRDFKLIAFTDLINAISKLDDFSHHALIDSPILSNDCSVCFEKVIKKGMFIYGCECQPSCNDCIMANMNANIASAGDLLMCFEKCFRNDKEKLEVEHSRLYNHLQCISRSNKSYEEIFSKFEKLLTSKVMEDASDTFNCPNKHCGKSWIIDQEAPDGTKLKRRIRCPYCNEHACRKCQQKWRKEHRNKRCVDYTRWLFVHHNEEVRDPTSVDIGGMLDYPKITCPECQSVYMLDRGGCLHFTCNNCKFEFCGFCSKPFHKPSKNPCYTCNTGKGLHAHHPRNCPFYTRDFWRDNTEKLMELLTNKNLTMDDVLRKNNSTSGKCDIVETNDDRDEKKCIKPCEEACQGYCQKHFVELLCGSLFTMKNIDPADIMNVAELRVICDRENVEYEKEDTEEKLREALRQNCPLDDD